MSEIKNGGSAFPVSPYSTDARHWSDGSEGMTLRDYFAAKAMQGWLASWPEESPSPKHETAQQIAETAYLVADAMLKYRGA